MSDTTSEGKEILDAIYEYACTYKLEHRTPPEAVYLTPYELHALAANHIAAKYMHWFKDGYEIFGMPVKHCNTVTGKFDSELYRKIT